MKRNSKNNKQQGNWLLHVPNNIFGKMFMWYFKRHVNRVAYDVRFRGRGKRADVARKLNLHVSVLQSDLPLRHAQSVAVYVEFRARREKEIIDERVEENLQIQKRLQAIQDFAGCSITKGA